MEKSSDQSAQKHSTAGTLAFLMFGPLIWAGQFTIAYGGHTLICAQGGSDIAVKALVFLTTLAAMVILGGFLYFQEKSAKLLGAPSGQPGGASRGISRILIGLSIIAILWTGVTVALLAACEQGR